MNTPIAPDARSIGVEAAKGFVRAYLCRRHADGAEWWRLGGLLQAYESIAVGLCGLSDLHGDIAEGVPDDVRAREFLALPELAGMRSRPGVREFLNPGPDTSAEETP